MFDVFKIKSKEQVQPVKTKEYIEKNKLPENIRYEACNRIREYRTKLGLTQSDVAEMLHITRQSLSLIEKGQQVPSILLSWLISKVLNVDIQELFYFQEIEEDLYEKRK